MCNEYKGSNQEHGVAAPGRRHVLKAGAALVAAPIMAGVTKVAQAAETEAPAESGPFRVRAFGAASATSPLVPM